MSQTSIVIKLGLIGALALIAAGMMMACESLPTPPSAPASPTTEADLAEDSPASPTNPTLPATSAGSTPTERELARVPPPTPTTPASPTPAPAVIAPDDGCEDCHTDKERLIATAEEEEVVEELSEGEG